ncbi:MAG: thiamine phosphate synthase [Xanthomonadales bacterium]|nr:thiamine phosphate synthase [Xanthomonadales bacterium]NIX13041.1 thiamine phosphate synthase [Xanthomonadales bacterium]
MSTLPERGLYALTPQWYPDLERLLGAVGASLAGGAAMVQFRDKSGDASWRLDAAQALRGLCDVYRAPLIVNDDVELALRAGARGVHVGRDDAGIREAREALGGEAVIGASCYNNLERAAEAVDAGADYLAFGSFYPSPTKPKAVRCGTDTLESARRFGLPLVAIGGITQENGPPVIRAGANFLAVITAVFDRADIESATREFAAFWD